MKDVFYDLISGTVQAWTMKREIILEQLYTSMLKPLEAGLFLPGVRFKRVPVDIVVPYPEDGVEVWGLEGLPYEEAIAECYDTIRDFADVTLNDEKDIEHWRKYCPSFFAA